MRKFSLAFGLTARSNEQVELRLRNSVRRQKETYVKSTHTVCNVFVSKYKHDYGANFGVISDVFRTST
jgi:hypothetical protein